MPRSPPTIDGWRWPSFELHTSTGNARLEKVAIARLGRIVVGGLGDGGVTVLRLWN